MGSLRVAGVRFSAWPQDHTPRHVHAFIGAGEVIVDLRADGTVALADRKDNVRGRVTRSEVRKVLTVAAGAFPSLVALWEKIHT